MQPGKFYRGYYCPKCEFKFFRQKHKIDFKKVLDLIRFFLQDTRLSHAKTDKRKKLCTLTKKVNTTEDMIDKLQS